MTVWERAPIQTNRSAPQDKVRYALSTTYRPC